MLKVDGHSGWRGDVLKAHGNMKADWLTVRQPETYDKQVPKMFASRQSAQSGPKTLEGKALRLPKVHDDLSSGQAIPTQNAWLPLEAPDMPQPSL